MWLLYFNRDPSKITYYGFCVLEPYKAGYWFKDLNKPITLSNIFLNTAEISLRKGKEYKNETKKLIQYLHNFNGKVYWKLFKGNKELDGNF